MAARTPDYTPLLAEGLQDQIIAILQRDFLANLNTINAAAAYPGIADYHKAEQDAYPNAPEAIVEPIETAIAQDDKAFITAQHVFAVSVYVSGGGDNEQLAQMSRDYARALVWTLGRRMDMSDYWTSLPIVYAGVSRNSTGMPAGTVKEVSIRHVGWALKGKQSTEFGRLPIVEIAIVTCED